MSPAGDPAAEEWSQWSVCSLTCGQGSQVRTRSCVSSPYGTLCSGLLRETRTCNNTATCPGTGDMGTPGGSEPAGVPSADEALGQCPKGWVDGRLWHVFVGAFWGCGSSCRWGDAVQGWGSVWQCWRGSIMCWAALSPVPISSHLPSCTSSCEITWSAASWGVSGMGAPVPHVTGAAAGGFDLGAAGLVTPLCPLGASPGCP